MAEEKISAGRWLARVDEYERWIARDNDGPEWLLIYRNSRDFCAQKALEAEAKERAEKAAEISRHDTEEVIRQLLAWFARDPHHEITVNCDSLHEAVANLRQKLEAKEGT